MKRGKLRKIAEPLIALLDEIGLILLLIAIGIYYLVSAGFISAVEAIIIIGGVIIFVAFMVYRVMTTYTRDIAIGKEALRGKRALVIEDIDPEGKVLLEGEIWRAKSIDGSTIPRGVKVYVVGFEDLTLLVEKR